MKMRQNKFYFSLLFLIIFSIAIFFTRIPRLHNDLITTDAVYWHSRSEKFLTGILTGDFEKTFQKYHPGVTLMWLMSGTALGVSYFQRISIPQVFDDFVNIDFYTKLVFVSWQFLLSLLAMYLLYKILRNKFIAFSSILLLNLEPFYVGNARLIHHDAPISLYILLGFCFAYLYFQSLKDTNESKNTYILIILSAFFLALAALSKTLFFGAFMFVLGFTSIFLINTYGLQRSLKFPLVLTIAYVVFYFSLFPALWVKPVSVLQQIILESYDTSEGTGHIQIMFGQETRNPGAIFYILLLITKTSLVTSIGVLLAFVLLLTKLFHLFNKKMYEKFQLNWIFYISFFYLTYFVIICYFEKKVDRYAIPLFPYLAIIAVYGWYGFYKKINKYLAIFFVLILGISTILFPLFTVFPHYLTYVNPIFGNANDSNKIIGQKLFGIGIFDLKEKIVKHFGENTSVAINDIGPLSSIYTKGKVYNVLSEHPNSYNVLVLGPNKDLPKGAKEEKSIAFKQVDSVYINGLEFWRIYKKYYK